MKVARFITLIALGAALLAAADFGYNFLYACTATPASGLVPCGLLPRLVYTGGQGTLQGFFLGFAISGGIVLTLGVANIGLACIHLLRPERTLF